MLHDFAPLELLLFLSASSVFFFFFFFCLSVSGSLCMRHVLVLTGFVSVYVCVRVCFNMTTGPLCSSVCVDIPCVGKVL